MKPQVSLVINCDTRIGWLDSCSEIRNHGDNSLLGCRSVDFLLAGVKNKVDFFSDCDLETILVIDQREEILQWVQDKLSRMVEDGIIQKLVIEKFDHSKPRWNDRLYIDSLRHASREYTVHMDGDCAAFRDPEFSFSALAIESLNSGYSFVCQQTQLPDQGGMWWASTRAFFCKRSTLDLEEIRRSLDDSYRRSMYGPRHAPCFEHLAALVSKGKVLYPPAQYDKFVVANWVTYRAGLLDWLNGLSFEEVRQYIFEKCGGLCGAEDLISQPFNLCTTP